MIEVLLALGITIIVMALVAQTLAHVRRVFEAQTDLATASSLTTLALDDIAREVAAAGQGLGEGLPAVLPMEPGSPVGPSSLTLRANPEILAGLFLEPLEVPGKNVGYYGSEELDSGQMVLLTNAVGVHERAEVVRAGSSAAAFRPLDGDGESFRDDYDRENGGRFLGLREVRYRFERKEGAASGQLVKTVTGVGSRVLARDLEDVAFEYLDRGGNDVALNRVASNPSVSTVRVRITFLTGDANPMEETATLVTAVTLARASGVVDFEAPNVGFRLTRMFSPLDRPVGVASKVGDDIGIILSAGHSPQQDPAYLYMFPLEKEFLGALVDQIFVLDDVRGPVTITYGPGEGPLRGSLFVAAWGLRIGHVTRILPDSTGSFSEEALTIPFDGTEAIAQAGGIAFGVDRALYITSHERGALYRYTFDGSGKPRGPERLFSVPGTPGAIVEGTDGHLYFLVDRGQEGDVWKMAFDETLSPTEPELIGALPGVGVSLARDPIEGSLLALVRERTGDFLVVELSRAWLKGTEDDEDSATRSESKHEPRVLFSLREWQRKLEEGRVEPGEIPFPVQELPLRMAQLRTDEVNFIAFDTLGALYMGATEANLVLKFELARPSGRYTVGVAAGVVELGELLAPEVRIHGWRRAPGLR